MSDTLTDHLLFATAVWEGAMKHAADLRPTLNLHRKDGMATVALAVMSKHDSSDIELLRSGVIPVIPPPYGQSGQRVLGTFLEQTIGLVYVSPAMRVNPLDPAATERTLMCWTYHRASATESQWCRLVRDDGTVSDPVDLDGTAVVGVDWIKEALGVRV